jgi:hypothetical protein
MSCSSVEEQLCAPPQRVLSHVNACERQDQLYRGALAPLIASDDPQLGEIDLSAHTHRMHAPLQPDAIQQQAPPHYALHHQRMHPSAAGWAAGADQQQTPRSRGVLREEEYLTSPEMIALWQRHCEDLDAVREETRAQSTGVSGSERPLSGFHESQGDIFHGVPPFHGAGNFQDPLAMDYAQMYSGPLGLQCLAAGRNLPSPAPSAASQPVLDREAGGGTGLAGQAAPGQAGAHWGPVHDRTNVPTSDVNEQNSGQSAWSKFAAGAAEHTDGRSDDELPMRGCDLYHRLCTYARCFHSI